MACSCTLCNHIQETNNHEDHHDSMWNRYNSIRFSVAAVFFIIGIILKIASEPFKMSVQFSGGAYAMALSSLFFIGSWLAAGLEVLQSLLKTISKGSIFNENFLMTFATIGAFILGEWSEGAAVMLFYNLGELLQAAAVQQSRRSITNLMDLRPEFVRLYHNPTSSESEHSEHHYSHSKGCEYEEGHSHSHLKNCECRHKHAECDCEQEHLHEYRDHGEARC